MAWGRSDGWYPGEDGPPEEDHEYDEAVLEAIKDKEDQLHLVNEKLWALQEQKAQLMEEIEKLYVI